MRLTPLIVVSVLFLVTDGLPSREEARNINATRNDVAGSGATSQNETTDDSSEGRRFSGGQSGVTSGPFSLAALARDPAALLTLGFLDAMGDHPTRMPMPTLNNTRSSVNMPSTHTKGHKRNDTHRGSSNSNIVFPTERPTVTVYSSKPPKCVQSEFGFCTQFENYPTQQVNDVVEDAKRKYSEYFDPPDVDVRTYSIAERTDAPSEQLCLSKTRTIIPDGGVDVDGELEVFVKNKEYKQAIVVVDCELRNQPCRYAEFFPVGMRATCEQKYLIRQFVTLNKASNTSKLDKFRVPSCCSCVLKKI